MSYDYFLQAHIEGDDQVVMTSEVLRIFQPYTSEVADSYIELDFGDSGSCTIFMNVASPFISNVNINRPCPGRELADCLYQVMRLGNFVFLEPDGKHVIIVDEETLQHLPEDVTEDIGELGGAVIANSQESFWQLYAGNRD